MKKMTLALIAVVAFSAAALNPLRAEGCCPGKEKKKEKTEETKS
jgi:hypothetical protein